MRRERAKKWMWMFCTLRFPSRVEFPYADLELLSFPAKISRIRDHQFLVRGIIPGKWLLVAIDGTHQWPEDPSQQHLRSYEPARSQVESSGAMRQHLRNLHFAPLSLRCRLEFVDTRDQFVHRLSLKQIFHADRSVTPNRRAESLKNDSTEADGLRQKEKRKTQRDLRNTCFNRAFNGPSRTA